MTPKHRGTWVRPGWLAVLAGLALALAIQVAAPAGVPLYDGVHAHEPFRYLHPTGDQAGNPSSFSADPAVTDGTSPTIVAATTESPPQAQLIAQQGAFAVPAGLTALRVTITPIDPPTPPPSGAILGNVYRISVTGPAGEPVPLSVCDGCISLVIRAPDGAGPGTIQRFADGAWSTVATVHAGTVAMYSTNPTELGDFAVVSGGAGGLFGGDLDLSLIVVGVGVGLMVLAAVGLLFLRGRSSPVRPDPEDRSTPGGRTVEGLPARVPSKRRRRRPPHEGGAAR